MFGLEPTDLLAYAVPVLLIGLGGGLAAAVPALKAAGVDPLIAVRSE